MSSKISALSALSSLAIGDLINVVDISDTSMGAGGTNKKVLFSDLMRRLALPGTDIVAASTTDLSTATGAAITITGNTTITSFGTVDAGVIHILTFSGTPVITYNATSLKLPTAASITAAAGDVAWIVSLGSGNWKIITYQRADGAALTGSGGYLGTVILQEQQTSGTEGGSASAGTTYTRTLNTEVSDASGLCSLSSNQFTLTAGTYELLAFVPSFAVAGSQAFLYDATAAAEVSGTLGANSYTGSNGYTVLSVIAAVFTAVSGHAYEIRHKVASTYASQGLGVSNYVSRTEAYTTVMLRRVS